MALQATLRRAVLYGLAAAACSFVLELLTIVLATAISPWGPIYIPRGGDILHALWYGIPVLAVVSTVFAVAPRRAFLFLWALGLLVWCIVLTRFLTGPGYQVSWLQRGPVLVEPFLEWTKYFAPIGLLMVITQRQFRTPSYMLAAAWSLAYLYVLWVRVRWLTTPGVDVDFERELTPLEELWYTNAAFAVVVKTLTLVVVLLWPLVCALVGLRRAARSGDQLASPSAA